PVPPPNSPRASPDATSPATTDLQPAAPADADKLGFEAVAHSFFLKLLLPPRPTPFPYTTLFRSPPPTPPASARTPRWPAPGRGGDRKSTRLNSSHQIISYAVFCLKKKTRRSYLVVG